MQREELTRRGLLAAGAAGAALFSARGFAAEEEGLKSRLLCEVEAALEPPQPIGKLPSGTTRSIFYAKEGTVKGPKINGVILAGGGDWYRQRADGVGEIDARGTIKTEDGALIYTYYPGIIDMRDGRGYFRTTPRFETAHEDYLWLNSIVAVGVGTSTGTGVAYKIYEIL